MNVGGFSKHQNNTIDTDRYKGYFFLPFASFKSIEHYEKNFWAVVSILQFLISDSSCTVH